MSGERRNIFAEETDDPKYADERNFYKVEKWTRDGTTVDRLIYAGNSLAKAHRLFDGAVKHRPRIRLTIRQRTRVLAVARGMTMQKREAPAVRRLAGASAVLSAQVAIVTISSSG